MNYETIRRRNVLLLTLLLSIVLLFVSGCGSIRPLAEYNHVSHATQHFEQGGSRTAYGLNMVGAGIRWRPTETVTVDLLENYVFEEMNGKHEVFVGRVTWEF